MGESRPQADAAAGTRAEILRAALDLFCHYGFGKTGMADIAQRCSMSPANLYRYFRNKQAIGLAVVEGHFEEAREVIAAAIEAAGEDPEARVRAMLRAAVAHIVTAMDQNPRIVELADFVCEDDEGWGILQRHLGWRRARLIEAIEAGNRAGAFRVADPEATAVAVHHAVKSFTAPFSLARWRDRTTVLPELEAVLDLVIAALRAGPVHGPRGG